MTVPQFLARIPVFEARYNYPEFTALSRPVNHKCDSQLDQWICERNNRVPVPSERQSSRDVPASQLAASGSGKATERPTRQNPEADLPRTSVE
jgi:hypothetical protein